MKKVFTFFLTLFVASSVWAYDFVVDGIYYDIDEELNSSVSVVYEGSKYEGSITIPSSVTYGGKTYSVTSIGDYAFYYCSGLTSVTIPNTVTSIGSYAFEDCTGLTSVTIPNSVEWIGGEAFRDCTGLTSLTIPNSVTCIGYWAFYGCSGLTSVTIPESLDVYDAGIYFTKEGMKYKVLNSKEVAVASNSYTGDVVIPQTVSTVGNTFSITSIEDEAFYYCFDLTSVTIPNSVTSIGYRAFEYCRGLTSVTIPNSVTSIGKAAFSDCSGLTLVTIPNTVTSIGNSAFYGCSGLTSITIGNSVTSIGYEAFYGCENLKEVINFSSLEIEKGSSYNGYVAYYADYVFNGQKTIVGDFIFGGNELVYYTGTSANVVLPEYFEGGSYTIGSEVFANNTEIQSVTIPNSVTSIGYDAFYGCSGLKEVINFSSLKIEKGSSYNGYVAYYADYVCNGEKTIVGDFIFGGNELVYYTGTSANVVLPENFEGGSYTIGSKAFANNTEIQSVTIPNSVTSIGNNAFSGCSGLTSLTIPNSVTSIGSDAFFECTGLTSITIPNSVTSIGSDAFSSCFGLTSITIPESLDVSSAGISFTKDGIWYYVLNGKEVELGGIENEKSTGDLVIPQIVSAGNTFTVTSIGDLAFYKCTSLTSVTIPNSVTSIGYDAFHDCTGLTSLTIPNSVTSIGERAFSDCSGLKSVIIGENVTTIGEKAFSDCSALSRVTCYAVNPPDADASSFSNYNGYLTIPCDNFEAYDIHPVWGSFKHVDCISAESTELPKDEVVVEPEISEAVFSMPTNASANSYTLTIQNNGVTFCTLTFNSQGQLSNIDFSGNTLKASVEGYQFTVTGLSASTGYNYSFKAFDKNKSVLKEYTGSFTTKNADGTGGSSTTAIDDVELANAISIVNNQIFVNGEAPEFVITSLGQKIANQNLKAGIYFVVVEGQNVSISIQ